LSALIGSVVGLLIGLGIYFANKSLTKKAGLATFSVLLLVLLSAGLFEDGCHTIETRTSNPTRQVWVLDAPFWDSDRLPMTLFKPFGYSSDRTVLQVVTFWCWLGLAALLHLRKYLISPKVLNKESEERRKDPQQVDDGRSLSDVSSKHPQDFDTVEMGDSSLDGGVYTTSSRGGSSLPQGSITQASEASYEVYLDGEVFRQDSSSLQGICCGPDVDDGDSAGNQIPEGRRTPPVLGDRADL